MYASVCLRTTLEENFEILNSNRNVEQKKKIPIRCFFPNCSALPFLVVFSLESKFQQSLPIIELHFHQVQTRSLSLVQIAIQTHFLLFVLQ